MQYCPYGMFVMSLQVAFAHYLRMSYYDNFWGDLGSNEWSLGAILELPAKQPILPDFLVNGPNWQCCLAGSSKTAPRILIFSIILGAK